MTPLTTIAVIDDDTAFIEMVSELLQEEGHTVATCKNGATAHSFVKEHQPAVVVLDVRIETPDAGWLALELLRLDPSTAAIPIILCSADGEFLRTKEAQLQAHTVDVLEKPFHIDELLAKIAAYLPPREREA